jgi:hypothetical protein
MGVTCAAMLSKNVRFHWLMQTFGIFNGWVLAIGIIAVIIAALVVSGLFVRFLVQGNVLSPPKIYALYGCSKYSIYSIVLTRRYAGWIVTIGMLIIQIAVFARFLKASQFDNQTVRYCPHNA